MIFFYCDKSLEKPEITLMYRNGYLLAKVVYATADSWFGKKMEDSTKRHDEKRKRGIRRGRSDKAGDNLILESMKACVALIYAKLRETGEFLEIHSVYGDQLEDLNSGKTIISKLWRRCWREAEFAGYLEFRWNQVLLENLQNQHFLLLGDSKCVPQVLDRLAGQMKSLRWIPGIGPDIAENIEQRLERVEETAYNLEEEYGLIVEINPEDLYFRENITIDFPKNRPICVLDFMKEVPGFSAGPAKGSIWVDFTASFTKRRRFSVYEKEMSYTSLIQYWEGCKRRIIFPDYQNEW